MKLYYILEGKVNIHMNKDTVVSRIERIDNVMFETLYLSYLYMTFTNVPQSTIKLEITALWLECEQTRDLILNGGFQSILSPPKARNSIVAFDFTALKLQATTSGEAQSNTNTLSPKTEINLSPSKKKSSRPNSSKKIPVNSVYWPGEGREGWHKLHSDSKIHIPSKMFNYNLVEKVLEVDEKGNKVKFKLNSFPNLYAADEILIHEVLQDDASFISKSGPTSSSLTFAEVNLVFTGRLDFILKYLPNQIGRLFQMLSKRYLGKSIRSLESLEMFGERALENKSARSASVIAEKSTK